MIIEVRRRYKDGKQASKLLNVLASSLLFSILKHRWLESFS
jgi:hypothetical protein